MVPLGTLASDFSLLDVRMGRQVSLQNLGSAPAYVVAFICNHCPYVLRIQETLVALLNRYASDGVACYAVSANDAEQYPADAPEAMQAIAAQYGYQFPYLYDETQQVARAYGAVCTPDFFVFDASCALVYHGQFDDSRPGNDIAVSGIDLEHAIVCVLSGADNERQQIPSLGCNIKWKTHE